MESEYLFSVSKTRLRSDLIKTGRRIEKITFEVRRSQPKSEPSIGAEVETKIETKIDMGAVMKKIGTIARALLTLALSTAVLAACNDRHSDSSTNGYYGGGGNGLDGGTCGQPIPQGGFQPIYESGGARPYAMNNGFRGGNNGRGYPGGYQNGFGGCGQNEFPACGNAYGQYQGGLMCLPNNGLNMGSVYGYGYNQGAFGQGQIGGMRSCGFGQPCGQIAQTCVLGMPNSCLNGVCFPVTRTVGVCAQ